MGSGRPVASSSNVLSINLYKDLGASDLRLSYSSGSANQLLVARNRACLPMKAGYLRRRLLYLMNAQSWRAVSDGDGSDVFAQIPHN